ncbi:unnamed protein product [Ilex paraguariensis]|uniref:Uncharacterized protein n=1 Tax=Ilex paraguariensis TaxID=185542 RepID=A0ABC8URH7_9AQUA
MEFEVLAAKKMSPLWIQCSSTACNRNPRKWSSYIASDSRTLRSGPQKLPYREYMPSVWQSFVSHKILVWASGDKNHQNRAIYLSEWLLPTLSLSDKFVIRDDGVIVVL